MCEVRVLYREDEVLFRSTANVIALKTASEQVEKLLC